MYRDIWHLFPGDRQEFWKETIRDADQLQEIRLRVGQPVILSGRDGECFLDEAGCFTDRREQAHRVSAAELEELLCHICHDSPYAYEDELRQGFITVPGGHRVGVAGQAVLENDGRLRTLKHISYMNIRIAHQIFGAADRVLPFLYEEGRFLNTLIVSPPGCGKTTLLRELIRLISDGNRFHGGLNVGVVDERSELAGSYLGIPQNDLGSRTDVLDACPKAIGMMLLLRSMSPQVLAVDELGSGEDVKALKAAATCGSRLLATIHGEGLRDIMEKCPELLERRMFECLIVMGKEDGLSVIGKIYRGEELYLAAFGRSDDSGRLPGAWSVVSGSGAWKNAGFA